MSEIDFLIAEEICSVVQNVKGIRPSHNCTLASLGVDSLGTIILIKKISETFDGIRVKPKEIFQSGLTIADLSVEIKEKLISKKSEILNELNNRSTGNNLTVEQTDFEVEVDGNNPMCSGI